MIYNCDCIFGLGFIPDKSVDCIITDPPYNLGEMSKSRNYHVQSMRENSFVSAEWDNLSPEEWEKLMQAFFENAAPKLKIGGNFVIFCNSLKIGKLYDLAEKQGLYYKITGVWHKKNPMPRNMNLHFVNSNEFWMHFVNKKRTGTFNNEGKLLADYFECCSPSTKERAGIKHPTQKPLAVITRLIEILSNPGDTIMDCFMGSGTTAVAAINTGRKFIGFETDENYFKAAQKRIREGMNDDGRGKEKSI